MNQKKNLLRAIAGALVLTLSLSCFAVPSMAAETGESRQEAVLSEAPEESPAEETTAEETTEAVTEEETTAEEVTEEETTAEETAAAETSAEESSAVETTAETSAEESAAEETSAPETAAAETAAAEESSAEEVLPEESVTDDVEAVKAVAGTEMTAPKDVRVTSNNSYGLVVAWDAVPGASSYIVYKYSGNKWVEIAKPTATSYTDASDMEVGTSCKYTVAAVGTVDGVTKTSSYNTAGVAGTVCPPQPKMKESISRGQTKLEIRWEEGEGVDLYCVYRKDDTGKWTRLSGSLKTNSYLDTTVTFGKEYTYAVISGVKKNNATYWSLFNSNGGVELNAEYAQTITARTVAKNQVVVGQPKLVGAKGIALKSITVNWEAVDGADGYIVYRSTTGKAGTWKRRKRIKSGDTLTYTDKKCTFNKKYYFTVRAYINYDGQEKAGSWDTKGVTAKSALAVPEKQVAQGAGLKSIKISWNKVTGASGYYIYRKVPNAKKWKRIGSTGAKTLTYTDKKLAGKDEYLYTVRAWRKSGKKKVKGLYDKNGVKGAVTVKKKMKKGLQLYYNEKGNLITDVEDIIGKRSSYRLEVDWDDNIVTVYAKGDNGTYNLPVKAFCCSTGEATPIGTFYTPAKYRWHELNGQLYGQWCTRIHGGVLFHSVYYYSYNNANDLSTSAYNKLGTKCSHGCVRLNCRDAKWIYDNCRLGTTVVIKKSCKNPFGKPSSYKINSKHTWDPTDPNMYYKCRNAGCH